MTKANRENLLVAALVLSVLAHIGLMVFVRTKVMTHVSGAPQRERRHDVVRVTDYAPPSDPVAIAMIKDIMSVKDAPAAEAAEAVVPVMEQLPDSAEKHWEGDVPAPEAPVADAVPVPVEAFDVKPIAVEANDAPDAIPMLEYTPPESRALAAPVFSAGTGSTPEFFGTPAPAPAVEAPSVAPVPAEGEVARMGGRSDDASRGDGGDGDSTPAFTPAEEVYEKVDEKIVEKEKDAVRELMDVDEAAPLEKIVNLTASRSEDADWTYFRLMVSPQQSLPVVPKDVVILIDASGSIGSDRLVSCRQAAKRILRSAFNSGDRFNLVAFRNNFTYAFKRWQECNQTSFDLADVWLSNLAAHGRTDVFGTIRSVLTLPRDPARPLIALVVTDGDANAGVSDTAQIISRFTDLNDGLVSVYMYGVKEGANRELIDVLTHGNRGESFIYGGSRWKAGEGIESLSERFRDPVLTDLRVIFTADSQATAYPRLLRNLYRGDVITIVGRVPKGRREVAFSIKGLNGKDTYEAFFRVPLDQIAADASIVPEWSSESAIDARLK